MEIDLHHAAMIELHHAALHRGDWVLVHSDMHYFFLISTDSGHFSMWQKPLSLLKLTGTAQHQISYYERQSARDQLSI